MEHWHSTVPSRLPSLRKILKFWSQDRLLTITPKPGKKKDGEPAVFATPFADVAIFRALVNAKGVYGESRSRFGMEGENPYFSATKKLLLKAKEKIGKIYVLDKKNFTDFKGTECRNHQALAPVEIIEVKFEDLPGNIKILPDEKK